MCLLFLCWTGVDDLIDPLVQTLSYFFTTSACVCRACAVLVPCLCAAVRVTSLLFVPVWVTCFCASVGGVLLGVSVDDVLLLLACPVSPPSNPDGKPLTAILAHQTRTTAGDAVFFQSLAAHGLTATPVRAAMLANRGHV